MFSHSSQTHIHVGPKASGTKSWKVALCLMRNGSRLRSGEETTEEGRENLPHMVLISSTVTSNPALDIVITAFYGFDELMSIESRFLAHRLQTHTSKQPRKGAHIVCLG